MIMSPAILSCAYASVASGMTVAFLQTYIPTYYKQALHLNLTSVNFEECSEVFSITYLVLFISERTFYCSTIPMSNGFKSAFWHDSRYVEKKD